jgi:hypothetical protein
MTHRWVATKEQGLLRVERALRHGHAQYFVQRAFAQAVSICGITTREKCWRVQESDWGCSRVVVPMP